MSLRSKHKYSVALRVTGPDLDYDEVTELLGLEPTQKAYSGEGGWDRNMWSHTVAAAESEDINVLIRRLVGTLNDRRLKFFMVRERFDCCVWCSVFHRSEEMGVCLDPETVEAVQKLNVRLCFMGYRVIEPD